VQSASRDFQEYKVGEGGFTEAGVGLDDDGDGVEVEGVEDDGNEKGFVDDVAVKGFDDETGIELGGAKGFDLDDGGGAKGLLFEVDVDPAAPKTKFPNPILTFSTAGFSTFSSSFSSGSSYLFRPVQARNVPSLSPSLSAIHSPVVHPHIYRTRSN
jgi:hypothetical protein